MTWAEVAYFLIGLVKVLVAVGGLTVMIILLMYGVLKLLKALGL